MGPWEQLSVKLRFEETTIVIQENESKYAYCEMVAVSALIY